MIWELEMKVDSEMKDALAEFFIWNILILAIPILLVISIFWQAKEILWRIFHYANFTARINKENS